jgi:RNA polymerase sigma factor (sigma-70 family)
MRRADANRGDSSQPAAGSFAPTRWTQVLLARGESPKAQEALGALCAAYWQPVFRFIQRWGFEEDAARDLTQEFFAGLLARRGLNTVQPGRGRFRSFVLGAVKHFLADQHDRARAAKRGGGQVPLALEGETDSSTNLQIPDPAGTVPDTYYDRQWGFTLVERALSSLAAEFAAEGKAEQFEVLKPWLLGNVESLSQADAAQLLGCSEGAVKVAVHRLRKRFGEAVRTEIAATVEEPAQVQDELRYLFEVLAHE